MTDDIRNTATASSDTTRAEPGIGHENHRHDSDSGHCDETHDNESPATANDADTTPSTTATDALDALESLRALDTDRKAVNDRPITATMATWNAALIGVIMIINAVAYWLLGWTVLGGHAAFTWTEYRLYIGGAVLLVALSAALLAYGQKHSGIGMWNGRLFWPDKRLMRNGRYRRIFTAYLVCVAAVPVMMALIGAFCTPWWPVVALAPICGLVATWLCRQQIEAYTRIITTPLTPETLDATGTASGTGTTSAAHAPHGTHETAGTEAGHDLG